MRIRSIKPEFWVHPIIARLDDSVRLTAIGLLSYSDDEGYFFAEPALIRAAIFPFDEDSTKARRTLEELSKPDVNFVEIYPSKHGQIGRVINFRKHQKIDRPAPSKIKQYIDCEQICEHSSSLRRVFDEPSLPEQGTGNREQGTGNREQGPEIVNFIESKIFKDVANFFSLSEIRNPNDLMFLNRFLNLRATNGNLGEFEKQFPAYCEYKKISKQATHSFRSFLGDLAENNGGWLVRDWVSELEKMQPVKSLKINRETIFEQ